MSLERIQKILAQAGVSSRRAAERLIVEGRVRVDGRIVTELGTKADPQSKIELDGKRLVRDQLCYGVLNKPRGMLTTLSDPEGRATVGAILKQVGMRVVPVGRLDYNTSGVLLFTNDGDFAEGLQHARSKVPKVYVAKVRGELNERELQKWAEQIEIDGRKTVPAAVKALRRERGHTWLEVTIHEGRNRQVRRLGEHAGTPLVRLVRTSHAGIEAEGLKPGEWRLLTIDELKELKASHGVPKKIRGAVQGLHQSEGQRSAVFREKLERIRLRRNSRSAPSMPASGSSRDGGRASGRDGERAKIPSTPRSERGDVRSSLRGEGRRSAPFERGEARTEQPERGKARRTARGEDVRSSLRGEGRRSAPFERGEARGPGRARGDDAKKPKRGARVPREARAAAQPRVSGRAGVERRPDPRPSQLEARGRGPAARPIKSGARGRGSDPRPRTRR